MPERLESMGCYPTCFQKRRIFLVIQFLLRLSVYADGVGQKDWMGVEKSLFPSDA